VVSVVAALFVLWPTRMRFSIDGDLTSTFRGDETSGESLTALTLTIHEARRVNENAAESQRRGIVVVTPATALQLLKSENMDCYLGN